MSAPPKLYWLPENQHWRSDIQNLRIDQVCAWQSTVALSKFRLNFLQTNALNAIISKDLGGFKPVESLNLAVLGSSTISHLSAAIRVGGLRRNIYIDIYEGGYGQFQQELVDTHTNLRAFQPDLVLFAFDATYLSRGVESAQTFADLEALAEERIAEAVACWGTARAAFRCDILQQTALPRAPSILGQNEQRWPSSAAILIDLINAKFRQRADEFGVDLVAIDRHVTTDGLKAWHDPALWYRTKQEILPTAAPVYGDLVARLIAARRGRSAKVLVLDLDNTLWGGVIGDDGLDGILLGQGSGQGEAFVEIQRYARMLAARGIVLSVCSKNDDVIARAVFEEHPEMMLRLDHIANFKANWRDKASNLQAIADELELGLDSLVFLDDNPFERNLVRQVLPSVHVPEFPDDPSDVPQLLSDAGYFESVGITSEDLNRTALYQSNISRKELLSKSIDIEAYLTNLEMILDWNHVSESGIQRALQLINKTNQFNLTTKRFGHDELVAFIRDERCFALQFKLLDRFGDNGIISVVMGRIDSEGAAHVVNWLMSCRVLGRHVEEAVLGVVARVARARGAGTLAGYYKPTAKNGMVRDHYAKLDFHAISDPSEKTARYCLELATYTLPNLPITIHELQS